MTSPEGGTPSEDAGNRRFEDVPDQRDIHRHRRRKENAVLSWAKAIALGVKDTAEAMVEEGKKGARRASEEQWREYEAKVKHPRRPRD